MNRSSPALRSLALGLCLGFAAGCLEPLIRVPAEPDGGTPAPDGGGLTCGAGLSVCANTCVNLQGDDTNCGACSIACAASQACAKGMCLERDCSTADCSAAQVCLSDACIDRTCVGVTCQAGQVCVEGQCRPGGVMCNGVQCPPTSVCQSGMCVDPACVGVRCAAGQSCLAGRCVSGCMSGTTCTPAGACAIGEVRCDGGMRCQAVGSVTPGTPCGANQVCDPTGACVGCTTGATCDAGPCQTGAVACGSGQPRCVVQTVAPAGTSCGQDLVCGADGGCVSCSAGSSCDAGACLSGVIACGSGASVCTTAGPAPGGTQCGAASFCDTDGGCLPCTAGASCTLSGAPCFNGTQQCAGGGACVAGAQKPAGTSCGLNQVCAADAGCVGCTQGAACDAGLCRLAAVDCASGGARCALQGVRSVGTQVTPNLVCAADGGEVACSVGTGCDAGVCRTGAIACSTGTPACTFAGFAPPGTQVGTNAFCTGDGGITTCVQGATCSTGNACENGFIECSSGSAVCTPVAGPGRFKPSTTTCRPAAGTCDVAETCTGASADCPVDGFESNVTVCRPAGAGSNATCDPAETCTGTSAACPTDVRALINTPCGSSSTVDCDAADSCDGAGVCVARFKPGSAVCRPSTDAICDPAETCTGASATCPVNGFASASTACGSSNATDCDAADTCSGAGSCVARVKGFGVSCRAAGPNAVCDPAELCDGVSTSCPTNGFATPGTSCMTSNGAGTCQAGGTCLTSPAWLYNGVCGTIPGNATNGTEFNCGPSGNFPLNLPTCTATSGPCSPVNTSCLAGSPGDQYREAYRCTPGGRVWVSPGPGAQCGYPGTNDCSTTTLPDCASFGFGGQGAACTTPGQSCITVAFYEPGAAQDLAACSAPPTCIRRGRAFTCVDR